MTGSRSVLYVVPYAPTPVRVRSWELIRALIHRGHRITVASPHTSPLERASLEALRLEGADLVSCALPRARILRNLARAAVSGSSLQARHSWSPKLMGAILQRTRSGAFDVVHVEHLRGLSYLSALARGPLSGRPRPALVWDAVDSIARLLEGTRERSELRQWRLLARLELRRTRTDERRGVRTADRTVVTSEDDRDALAADRAVEGGTDVDVVPNGVDAHRFRPPRGPRAEQTLVFSGKMSYHANASAVLWFAREVMPRIWATRPLATLDVVGRAPGRRVRALVAGSEGRIRVRGEVDDLGAQIGRATLAVAPLRYGAGIQNKVLEALATSTPVVASSVAVSGLPDAAREFVRVADDAEATARAIHDLLDRPEERSRLATGGRTFVTTHYRWDDRAALLEDAYEAALDRRARR